MCIQSFWLWNSNLNSEYQGPITVLSTVFWAVDKLLTKTKRHYSREMRSCGMTQLLSFLHCRQQPPPVPYSLPAVSTSSLPPPLTGRSDLCGFLPGFCFLPFQFTLVSKICLPPLHLDPLKNQQAWVPFCLQAHFRHNMFQYLQEPGRSRWIPSFPPTSPQAEHNGMRRWLFQCVMLPVKSNYRVWHHKYIIDL